MCTGGWVVRLHAAYIKYVSKRRIPHRNYPTFLFHYSDFLCLIFDLRVVYDSYQQVRGFLKNPLVCIPKGLQKPGRRTSGESSAAYIKYVSRGESRSLTTPDFER